MIELKAIVLGVVFIIAGFAMLFLSARYPGLYVAGMGAAALGALIAIFGLAGAGHEEKSASHH